MNPRRKPLEINTTFEMPKTYEHVSMLYDGDRIVGIIEARPPRKIAVASDVPHDSKLESQLLDWSSSVINTIRKDNGQPI